ncbi:MAG TPA: redoxin family protein [Candidatus Paceibacterota bacterium]|nr:redoxin family protein [Candidatus Paceibacterota bacterium]
MKNLKKPEVIISAVIALAIIAGAVLYFKTPQGNITAARPGGSLLHDEGPAPEITSPDGYINTGGKPITFGEFKGKKVVLVDIWTYSCINCQRTLPYIKAWYDKYSDQGLEIIGIHTPEFSFEKVQKNVEDAVERLGIKYPFVLDNEYGTWNAFGNQYWPRKYLIDVDGNIVYDHIGEGGYEDTEKAIQEALMDRDAKLGISPADVTATSSAPENPIDAEFSAIGSPETYFGSARNQYLANGKESASGIQSLILPANPELNGLYLGGNWDFFPEYAESSAGGKIVYKYDSKNVYFVASAKDPSRPVKIKVLVDGKEPGDMHGADIAPDGTGTISESRLYHLLGGENYGTHTVEIDVIDGTLDAFTFTFG